MLALGVLPERLLARPVPDRSKVWLSIDFLREKKTVRGGNFRSARARGKYCRTRQFLPREVGK
jgi:hypothetical protein